jgi:integrase/recombinase XerD
VFLATGIRRSEMAGIRYDPVGPGRSDLNLPGWETRVRGKARRERIVKIGYQVARALDRCLRARATHPQAGRPQLWLGAAGKGPVTETGIYQIVTRTGKKAGVHAYPHRFRHHFSHTWQVGRIASDATFPQKRDHEAVGDAGGPIAGTCVSTMVNPQVKVGV